jgi:hypothetical protein
VNVAQVNLCQESEKEKASNKIPSLLEMNIKSPEFKNDKKSSNNKNSFNRYLNDLGLSLVQIGEIKTNAATVNVDEYFSDFTPLDVANEIYKKPETTLQSPSTSFDYSQYLKDSNMANDGEVEDESGLIIDESYYTSDYEQEEKKDSQSEDDQPSIDTSNFLLKAPSVAKIDINIVGTQIKFKLGDLTMEPYTGPPIKAKPKAKKKYRTKRPNKCLTSAYRRALYQRNVRDINAMRAFKYKMKHIHEEENRKIFQEEMVVNANVDFDVIDADEDKQLRKLKRRGSFYRPWKIGKEI